MGQQTTRTVQGVAVAIAAATVAAGLVGHGPIRWAWVAVLPCVWLSWRTRERGVGSREAAQTVADDLTDAVLLVTAGGMIRHANGAAERLLGWSTADLALRPMSSLMTDEDRPDFRLPRAGHENRDYVVRTADGSNLAVSLTGSVLSGADEYLFILRDATLRRAAQRRVNFLAKHDGLTRIPNRMQFQHLLQQALARARRTGSGLALLYIDVDRFKEVNDGFGHAAGDRALELLSERLVGSLPAGAVLGRLAGDEFAAFLPDLGDDPRGALGALARDLAARMGLAFYLQETEIYLTISIGIALGLQDADHPTELIRCADVAMYHAKDSGGGTHLFYTPTMSAVAVERLVLKNKLRRSIELDELVTVYQPLVALASGRVIGAEALLRWRLPGHGDMPPSEFIPLAEQSGLIHEIGAWVFDRVGADCRSWRDAGLTPERVSINLSLRQLARGGTVERIAGLLRAHAVAPSSIELEITESTLMDTGRSRANLDALIAIGFRLAIDDFGTGYSSLAALRHMPVQTLKIDRSFIARMVENEDDAQLVRTIIDMGVNLGLEVVAEGVETAAQHDLLTRWGCHLGQGRWYGDPLDAAEFQRRLHDSPAEGRVSA